MQHYIGRRPAGTLRFSTLFALVGAFACGSSDGPVGPAVPGGALKFTDLGAGYFHTCALATTTSKAYCWGGNDFGTLGDGTRTTRMKPTAVLTNLTFTALEVGAGHNCGLTSTGAVLCWGRNDEGQLGDGSKTDRLQPAAVIGGLTFTAISAGHAHSCGLRANGTAYCWGDDSRGQLGNGGPEGVLNSAQPVQVTFAQPFTRIHAGYYQSCGVAADGIYCWGRNDDGQLGDGTKTDRHVPTKVVTDLVFTSIALGDRFVCGVSQGAVYCWGANRTGELGTAPATGSTAPVAIPNATAMLAAVTSSGASTIGSAEAYGCGVRSNGVAECWGGAIRAFRMRSPTVTRLDASISFSAVAPGAEHVCGLNREGYAFCGGGNYAGQLGDGTRTDRGFMVGVVAP
jgi:alpha-tubulin suppressor-like RCC1 family protein